MTKKATILDIEGKKVKEIEMPEFFSANIREDIVAKVLESKKIKQPYSPSLVGGKQHSASGKIRHRRHVWKTHYGKGISRIPRKIMSRKGSQFGWEAAEVASTRGGRRVHPPKILPMINRNKINKKELKIALVSALSATANEKKIAKKYESLKDEKINHLPFIIESKITSLKTQDILASLKKILGEKIFNVAVKKKEVRAGIGKLRGRRYKSSAGMLLVTGKKEKVKTKILDLANAGNLNVNELAKGGTGRIVVYTENAVKELEEKIK